MTATVTIWSTVLFTVVIVIAIYASKADIASAIASTLGFSTSALPVTASPAVCTLLHLYNHGATTIGG
jgi:hypothetical protein